MSTNLDLANRALLELGQGRLLDSNDLSNPSFAQARVVATALPSAVADVLSRFGFPAARKVVKLTTPTTPTDKEFEKAFTLPSDLSTFRKVTDELGTKLDYRLEGSEVLTNEAPVFLHYNAQITDISLLPDYVFTPTVFWLASIIAKAITGEMSDRDRMRQYYEDAYRAARTKASQEMAPAFLKSAKTSTFLSAHHGYGDV